MSAKNNSVSQFMEDLSEDGVARVNGGTINELSKETLRSYIHKASSDSAEHTIAAADRDADRHLLDKLGAVDDRTHDKMVKLSDRDREKAEKRRRGISVADSHLAEDDLNEARIHPNDKAAQAGFKHLGFTLSPVGELVDRNGKSTGLHYAADNSGFTGVIDTRHRNADGSGATMHPFRGRAHQSLLLKQLLGEDLDEAMDEGASLTGSKAINNVSRYVAHTIDEQLRAKRARAVNEVSDALVGRYAIAAMRNVDHKRKMVANLRDMIKNSPHGSHLDSKFAKRLNKVADEDERKSIRRDDAIIKAVRRLAVGHAAVTEAANDGKYAVKLNIGTRKGRSREEVPETKIRDELKKHGFDVKRMRIKQRGEFEPTAVVSAHTSAPVHDLDKVVDHLSKSLDQEAIAMRHHHHGVLAGPGKENWGGHFNSKYYIEAAATWLNDDELNKQKFTDFGSALDAMGLASIFKDVSHKGSHLHTFEGPEGTHMFHEFIPAGKHEVTLTMATPEGLRVGAGSHESPHEAVMNAMRDFRKSLKREHSAK